MTRSVPMLALPILALPAALLAQSVVVDQGTFAIEIAGEDAGSEEFTVQRSGIGPEALYFATGVATLSDSEPPREYRPLLRTQGAQGVGVAYQMTVSGAEPVEVRMNLAPPRYVARFTSAGGQEEREFRARGQTRVIDRFIAHQFHFLGTAANGDVVPIVEPLSRSEYEATVTSVTEEELDLGVVRVPARRLVLDAASGSRTIWFDRQDRVLRVEIPFLNYVAQRTDLVG